MNEFRFFGPNPLAQPRAPCYNSHNTKPDQKRNNGVAKPRPWLATPFLFPRWGASNHKGVQSFRTVRLFPFRREEHCRKEGTTDEKAQTSTCVDDGRRHGAEPAGGLWIVHPAAGGRRVGDRLLLRGGRRREVFLRRLTKTPPESRSVFPPPGRRAESLLQGVCPLCRTVSRSSTVSKAPSWSGATLPRW